MPTRRLTILALAISGGLFAAPPTIDIPAEIRPTGQWVRFTPKGDAASVLYVSLDNTDPFPSEELKDSRRFLLHVAGVAPGRYRFAAVAASKDGEQTRTDFTVVIGDVPPGPGPGPGPNPPPGPVPIPGEGLRVLVVLESADRTKLPAAVINTLQSGDVAAYLNAKCPVGPDGKTREWRIWDQNVDVTKAPANFAAALKRPRTSLPWVVISNGKSGYEGPLPTTPEAYLELLKKYGG